MRRAVIVEDLKRTATPTPTVGDLRQQTALQSSDTPILDTLRVVQVYPDTWTSDGEWKSCFKVEVVRR